MSRNRSHRAVQLVLVSASIWVATAGHAQATRERSKLEPVKIEDRDRARLLEESLKKEEQAKRLDAGAPASLPAYLAGQQGPAGGHGGSRCESFNVPTDWRLAGINVWSGKFIDRIELSYDVAGAPELTEPPPCGGTGGRPGKLLLIDRDEFIVRVMGKWALVPRESPLHPPESPAISYLYVQTSKGKAREYGNGATAGTPFDYIAVEGTEIAGLVVNSGTLVNAIGVVLRKTRNNAEMQLPLRIRE